MSQATLADQLGWCITTKDALHEFNASCVAAANSVDSVVNILRSSNFSECNRPLEAVYPDFQDATKALYRQINEVNAPYIQKQIDALLKVING